MIFHPSNTVISLFEDCHQRLWVGTSEGLHLYLKDKNCFKRFVHSDNDPMSISDNSIRTITEDNNRNLWFGTNDGGISQLQQDGRSFKNYRHAVWHTSQSGYILSALLPGSN